MKLKLQRRAAFGWGPSAAGSANPRIGMAVHYEGGNTGIYNWSHSQCVTHWKKTRTFHMGPARRWLDIGYSFGVCPHYVLEGRGRNKAQAAQPGGNTTWYSCTFMTGPGERIHPGQVVNFIQLRAWLMATSIGSAVWPHSKFVSTGCPGDILRRMITSGELTTIPKEEDVVTKADKDDIINGVVNRLTSNSEFLNAIAREVLFSTRFNLYNVTEDRQPENVNLATAVSRSGQVSAQHLKEDHGHILRLSD